MRVAVVTDDGNTISAHFGMARRYLIYQIEGGKIKGKEVREKASHGMGMHGHHHEGGEAEMGVTHMDMLSNVRDCEVIIARGMGAPMYQFIKNLGMKAFITTKENADGAVEELAKGKLDSHTEFLH